MWFRLFYHVRVIGSTIYSAFSFRLPIADCLFPNVHSQLTGLEIMEYRLMLMHPSTPT
ncbi:hypothetical protein PN466_18505 [Roseofilum reptotaenium CS-1145]|nr:hypothetical protein [Roseofilum reptotaenium CS-1145]